MDQTHGKDITFCYEGLTMNKAVFKSLRCIFFSVLWGKNSSCDDEACLTNYPR